MSNGTTIISHTLPTIVGMGVVSETTRTMFGKGRGGSGSRRGKTGTAKSKRFDGKTYQAANWHPSKAQAVKDAAFFRKAGHNARVVREYNAKQGRWGYMVYVR